MSINGKVLLIAGDDTHRRQHRDLEDDIMEGIGIGRLGPSASLPGNPDDDRGWSFTGFFDTSESQALLEFQQHSWPETVAWVSESQGGRRTLRALGPVIRTAMRTMLAIQRTYRKARALRRPMDTDRRQVRSRRAGSDQLLMTAAYPPNTALGRFGIAPIVDSPDPFVSSMPLAGLVNPVTGAPTVGPLAVLVDHAAGLVNHYRRAPDEWTVSSELTLEITPDALDVVADNPALAAVATRSTYGRPRLERTWQLRDHDWRRGDRHRDGSVRVPGASG